MGFDRDDRARRRVATGVVEQFRQGPPQMLGITFDDEIGGDPPVHDAILGEVAGGSNRALDQRSEGDGASQRRRSRDVELVKLQQPIDESGHVRRVSRDALRQHALGRVVDLVPARVEDLGRPANDGERGP